MPMIAFPTRYRPRNPNTYVSPEVLTPPEDDVPAAFNPNAINAQNQDSPSLSPRPDEIPKPPVLNDTQAGASLENLPPINPDVASKSAMPAFARNSAIMPPPGISPPVDAAIQPAATAPPSSPPATAATTAPASADVAKQALADTATNLKKLSEAKAPDKPNSNLAQRIGLAILSMTKLAPHANQIIHPKWSEEEAAYERGLQDVQGKLKGADTALSAVSHGEEQEAIAEQRKMQAANYANVEADRKQAAIEKIAAQKSKANQDHLNNITKGHDFQYQSATEPPPPGWSFTPNPDEPGFGIAISPGVRDLPKELLPYFPGKKEGDLVPYQDFKTQQAAWNADNRERLKADVKPDKPITNEYQGILQEFTKPDGTIDYAKANAESDKRQVQRALASRPPAQPNEAREKSRAINSAFAASGNDWNKVLDGVRSGKFSDYAADIADHAQKMIALPPAQQTKVNTADTTVDQAQTAIDAIKSFTAAHPELVGSGLKHPGIGLARWWETKTGTEPADIGNVDMALSSVAALQPSQHGFRSVQALDEFKRNLGIDLRTHQYDPNRAWLINPDKAISALQGVASFNKTLKENTLKNAGKGSPGASTSTQLPPEAASQLKEGHDTTFANGQVWTLKNGQQVRVK